ncbi:alpha-L-fucosidase [Echinicola sediminis]
MIKRLIFALLVLSSCKNNDAPLEPVGPVPSERQMAWQQMETYAFVHFGLNTFTDIEWGYGDTPASVFDPSDLDVEQWCRVFKDAGLQGVIITAKHHDGFCLWPSAYTDYSVKNSPWKDGQGDLIRELSEACKKYDLKFGVYLSPWDRNHAAYGSPEYITYFRDQLRELLTNYGEVFEVWFDGANGGSGYYGGANENRNVDRKTYYDWPNTYKIVRELQPNAVLFSDAGPDVRWCGTEEGWVGETNWSTLRRDEVWPGWPHYEQLRYGHEDGDYWVPAEVDVSVRPGWFYHSSEDHKVKSVPELLDIYYQSVGRNATLLLNFAVDKTGQVHEIDEQNVLEMAEVIKKDFETDLALDAEVSASSERGDYPIDNLLTGNREVFWVAADEDDTPSFTLSFDRPTTINRFLIQEYIELGQRVEAFELLVEDENGEWKKVAEETTIGYKRILRFPSLSTQKVKVNFVKSESSPVISKVGLYNAPKVMGKPKVSRNQEGLVTIESVDNELSIYYTLDGTEPNEGSLKYTGTFVHDEKVEIRAIAVDSESGKKSPVAIEKFDVSKKEWRVLDAKEEDYRKILDGDSHSVWHPEVEKLPFELKIDLGKVQEIAGFKYLPDQNRWSSGIIFNYELLVSVDGDRWKKVQEGEFSNIKNSPIWQEKVFTTAEKGRYILFRALDNVNQDQAVGIAEFDVITK